MILEPVLEVLMPSNLRVGGKYLIFSTRLSGSLLIMILPLFALCLGCLLILELILQSNKLHQSFLDAMSRLVLEKSIQVYLKPLKNELYHVSDCNNVLVNDAMFTVTLDSQQLFAYTCNDQDLSKEIHYQFIK